MDKLAVLADQVKGSEESHAASLSNAVVLLSHGYHPLLENLSHLLGMADDVLLDHVSHGLVACNAADWMSLIGGSPS